MLTYLNKMREQMQNEMNIQISFTTSYTRCAKKTADVFHKLDGKHDCLYQKKRK